jgi:nucleoside-triphosphatase
MKAVSALKEKGYRVGGIISREVREGETRMGFEILDLSSGRRGWLARMNKGHGPQVGKYRVNIKNLDAIGADAIADALEICDIIAIDEIGPMELFSEGFKQATRKALENRKPVLAVVHWKARDRLINEAKNRDDSEIFTVTYENRDKLPEAIVEKTITSYQLKKAHSDLNQAF